MSSLRAQYERWSAAAKRLGLPAIGAVADRRKRNYVTDNKWWREDHDTLPEVSDLICHLFFLDGEGESHVAQVQSDEVRLRKSREKLAVHDKRRAEIYAAALAAGLTGKLAEELKR